MFESTRAIGWLVDADEIDLAVGNLWLWDTLGVQTQDDTGGVRLSAWFGEGAELPLDEPDWPAPSARLIENRTQTSRDWLTEYRRVSRPFPVGTRFQVDPRETSEPSSSRPEGRWWLSIPARGAFGVGSHPSTALVIEMLETLPMRGVRVLDVGCGTGILSFAAERLGAGQTVGFDVEIEAAVAAHENAVRNGLKGPTFAGRIGALSKTAKFDLVLVNVLPERIRAELAGVLERLSASGSVVLSGLLAEQVSEVMGRMAAYGFRCVDERKADDWAALRCARHLA